MISNIFYNILSRFLNDHMNKFINIKLKLLVFFKKKRKYAGIFN